MTDVLIDVDGVLANTSRPVAARLGALYNPNVWDFGLSAAPERFDHDAFWQWFGTIAGQLEVYPGAQEFVERVRKHYTVVFATSPMDSPTWQHDRLRWLQQHFGVLRTKNVMQGDRKDLLAAHALIDDKPGNHSPRQELSILFDQPYNRGPETAHLLRARSYDEAYRILRGWA